MTKIVLDDVASGYNLSKINANFDEVATEFQNKVLYRDNPTGEPNQMENDLDMNANDVINTGVVYASTLVLGGVTVVPGDVQAVDPAYPVQVGQEGKFLKTNGANVSWDNPLTPLASTSDPALGAALVGRAVTTDTVQTLTGEKTYEDVGFPITKEQARGGFKAFTVNANGEGVNAFQALSVNGTLLPSTYANFLATATPDVVGMSAWGLRGGAGTNPIVAANFGSWIENTSGAITWAVEIDSNNEAATLAEGSDNAGIALAINTGSTYSPDTAIAIRRITGAGSAPGFLRGMLIAGARNTGIRIEAMSPVTYPSVTPAPTSSIQALQVLVSNDSYLRYMLDQSGNMNWGSGAVASDVALGRSAAGVLTVTGAINDTVEWVNFTPTITAGTGTFTSVAGSGRYNQIGKRVFFVLRVVITTNGTAAGSVIATLPVNAKTTLPQTASGRERVVAGKSLVAAINSATMNIFNYDNSYPGSDTADIIIQGVYEAA